LRRVAALISEPKLTQAIFNKHGKVHSSTIQRRFSGWIKALEAAGLKARIDGGGIIWSREDLLSAVQSLAEKLQKNVLTRKEFEVHTGISHSPIERLFGSWQATLAAAGLSQSSLGKRYSDEECFENLLAVWTHYGRPPQHDEMNQAPSTVGPKAYVRRWGTWRKALAAFVQRVNQDPVPEEEPTTDATQQAETPPIALQRGPRGIPLSLRYFILKRDSFRCVSCGASPAIAPGTILHVDHILAWASGGPTVAGNLRTLCLPCNLGKGTSEA
jgi:hypothetical protein